MLKRRLRYFAASRYICLSLKGKRECMSRPKDDLTFRFKDHYVAEFTLSLLVEALHLDVVGGLRLEVSDGVPVSVSFHHVLLIVAVIIAVCRPVVDVEAIDGRVVYGSVLLKRK